MHKTVIGAFENDSEALQAQQELLSAGFPEELMSLHYSTAPEPEENLPNDNPGFMEAIRSLFTWDLENYRDESYGDHYVEAVRRGHAVLTIDVDDSEVERVSELMDGAGALDIDEKLDEWRAQGYTDEQSAGLGKGPGISYADQGLNQPASRRKVRVVPANPPRMRNL
jgi:hypothetical protein